MPAAILAIAALSSPAAADEYCVYVTGQNPVCVYVATIDTECLVEVGHCEPGAECVVNVGYCAEGGRCTVNVGYCRDGTSSIVWI